MRCALILSIATIPLTAADRAIPAKAVLETAQAQYRTQVLGDLDHPVGERLLIAGASIATRLGAKGELELDLLGDGKFKTYSKSQLVQIAVEVPAGEGKKPKSSKLSIFLERHDDGTWTYRTASQLAIGLGNERLVIVDVNGDGAFNGAGVDGMTWGGSEWLFPLPAANERFCTASLDLTGLSLGALGDGVQLQGQPITTTIPAALPVLLDVNRERIKLGLTPRPEDVKLSADLQKHCVYMSTNDKLTHPEDAGKPGYTKEGHDAGMRSILSMGTAADRVAAMMVETYFHRQDVIRPETLAFGVGYEGKYGGIDGRTNMGKASSYRWPVLCPVPDQADIPLLYQKESPDATPGDDKSGYPITAYFGSGKATLVSYQLVASDAPKTPIDCYAFDHKTGASPEFSGYQHSVCIITKDPLKPSTEYQVTLSVDHDGKPWEKTWRFSTIGGGKRGQPAKR